MKIIRKHHQFFSICLSFVVGIAGGSPSFGQDIDYRAEGRNTVNSQLEQAASLLPNNPAAAKSIAEQLLDVRLNHSEQVRAYTLLCGSTLRSEGAEAAMPACDQAVAATEGIDDIGLIIDARNARATTYYEYGNVGKAFSDFRAGLDLARRHKDQSRASRGANNLGVLTRNAGALEQAIELFGEAAEIAEASGEFRTLAVAALNLGDSFTEMGRFEGAYLHLERSLAAAEAADDRRWAFNARLSIAWTLLEQARIDEALERLVPLVEPPTFEPESVEFARGLEVLARAYSKSGQHDLSIVNVERSLSILRNLDARWREHKLLVVAAELRRAQGDLAGAESDVEKAIEFARLQGNDRLLRDALREYTKVLGERGDYEAAIIADQEADALHTAFYNEQVDDQLSILETDLDRLRTERELERVKEQANAESLRAQRDLILRNGIILALIMGLAIVWLWRDWRLRNNLADLVKQRTSALEEETETRHGLEAQLAQARKLESIGKLTGGIAHDFNNLLTVIIGALDMIKSDAKGRLRPNEMAALDDALAASASGAETTQQLLTFARKQQLKPESIDLNEYLKEISGLLRRSLGATRSFDFKAHSKTVPIRIDKGQLTSALLNLVINARDATSRTGTVKIELDTVGIGATSSWNNLGPGRYARIIVDDDGCGMADDVRELACDPFFTTKSDGTGSGLGLSMVYGFVRQSKGDLRIKSEPGNGTHIELLLPLTQMSVTAYADVPTGEDLSLRPQEQKALVLEDQPDVGELAATYLSEIGFDVTVAKNSDDARQLITDGLRPALVFADVVVPGHLDGAEFANWAQQRLPDTQVLLTTGYADKPTGDIPLVPKPYRFDDIAAFVRARFPTVAKKR